MFNRITAAKSCVRLVAILTAGSIVAGCASHPAESSYVIAQPQASPVSTVTNFTESLRCMDDLFLRLRYTAGVPITSMGLPDRTLKINAGTRDMMISAISAMSLRSNSFKYIDLDREMQVEMGVPHSLVSGLYIRGSISQLDEGVTDDSTSGGASFSPVVGSAVSDQHMVAQMTVDMSLVDAASHSVLPGTSVSNTLAIARRTKGADFDARVGSVGLNYDLNTTESEGSHAGLRALIELSMIEIVGRYAKVPYWQCLGLSVTDPRARTEAFDQYSGLRDEQRVAFVAAALKSAGYYNGPDVTAMTADLRAATGRYEQENNLTPTGLVSFELYLALANSHPVADLSPPGTTLASVPPPAQLPIAAAPTIGLARESANTGWVFQGETIRFTADLARDGYLACFYQDGDGKLFRAFPNPHQPNEFVQARHRITIPGAGDQFRLHPTTVGQHEVFVCFSSSRSLLGGLPPDTGGQALVVLPTTMGGIAQQLQSALGGDLYVATNGYQVVGDPPK